MQLTSHLLSICWSTDRIRSDWDQLWNLRKKKDVSEIIVADDEGIDMFEQAGGTAE
jgi:hypothetical protein